MAGDVRPAALSFRQVRKQFRHRGVVTPALEDINLEVQEGEFVCLVGPSGCGKSTLLKMAAGFTVPDAGAVHSAEGPITGPSASRGILFQTPTLFPWLTVLDNILFGPRAQGRKVTEVHDEALHLLRMVGLDGFAHHYPHQLSGGMQHRLALARALINRPPILLMDEPFGALDAITRAAMQSLLLDLWQRERMTILFVTHDVEEATLLGDRVCVMSARPGRVVNVVPVPIPRPRAYEVTETTEFIRIKRHLRELVEHSLRAAAEPGTASASGE